MSMLTLIQSFCQRTNIPRPSTVLGSTDDQVLQALSLLEEEGQDLVTRGDWQEITYEAVHTTIAVENQGKMSAIASNGFSYIKNNTIWDRTLRLPVYIIDDEDWQQVKAIEVTGPRYQARIRGGNLISNPTPVAGNIWAFEYVSENWILGADGTTYSQYFNLDTDTLLFPDKLLMMGLRWRWKKEKGLEYAEDYNTYEGMIAKALSRNGVKRKLSLSEGRYTPEPRVYVPDTFSL